MNTSAKADEFQDASTSVIARIAIKIPPFWPDEPALWFAQLESQFVLANITSDSTKYHHVSSCLEQQYAKEVKDFINNPPTENRYESFKKLLIKRLSASQEKKVLQLVNHEELGDRKPSQFLRDLRTLAGATVTDKFLATLWSDRLPQSIRTVIATQNVPLDELAELADKVFEIVPSTPQVAAVNNSGHLVELAKIVTELKQEVASLRSQVQSTQQVRHRSRSGNRKYFNRNRSRSPSKPRNPDVCWYHDRFGDRATKCTTPCNYSTKAGNFSGSRQ